MILESRRQMHAISSHKLPDRKLWLGFGFYSIVNVIETVNTNLYAFVGRDNKYIDLY